MSIQPIKEYNNGLFDVQEIYDDAGFKILETTTNTLWNNSEEEPITIAKSRRGDYFETTEPCDPVEKSQQREDEVEENNE